MSKKRLYLVDADYAPYAYGNMTDLDAIIKPQEWLLNLQTQLGPADSILCLSGGNNFRYKVATLKEYKATRKTKEKPTYYDNIRELLQSKGNCLTINGAEADDLITILYNTYKDKYDVWIISDDKDFNRIKCKQYRHTSNVTLDVTDEIVIRSTAKTNPKTDLIEYASHYEYYGEFAFYYQMLIGDSADNIPGIPGIGANNKLFSTIFVPGITIAQARIIVWKEYLKHYTTNACAAYLEQCRLLRLMTHNVNV